MCPALQAALFCASLAIIVLAAGIIILALQARRRLERLLQATERVQADVQMLVQDSRELVRNVNALTQRANERMDEVGTVMRTLQQWTERADRLVQEVGSVVEPPVVALVRNVNLIRTGVATFLQAWSRIRQRRQTETTQNAATEENDYV